MTMGILLLNDSSFSSYNPLVRDYGRVFHLGTYDRNAMTLAKGLLQGDLAEDRTGLVVFTGGSDVSPGKYGEKPAQFVYPNDARDEFEFNVFALAKENKVPCLGICRGSQLLCVANGGGLYQDVTNHTTGHILRTSEGKEFGVTSTHHQMMRLRGLKNYKLLGWAKNRLSDHYKTGTGFAPVIDYPPHEPEVVIFNDNGHKSLAVQFHPEYMPLTSEGRKYFDSTLAEFLEEK